MNTTKCFIRNIPLLGSGLALSLDVIFHLVEDEVFDAYMKRLFENDYPHESGNLDSTSLSDFHIFELSA